jgi:aryl-alcohol dehydrogenase-like predicted oxidoreductase
MADRSAPVTHDRTPLGSTDLLVSSLGVGTWAWGDKLFWGYGSDYTDAELEEAFYTALAEGITLFDTAEIYGQGRSETLIGQWLPSAQSAILATKFMPWRWSSASLLTALRQSLARLGVAQVDLYQIHWPAPPMSIEVWIHALADAIEAGLTRTVGVSNFSAAQMQRASALLEQRGLTLASNQVQYSLLHRTPEQDEVLATCRHKNISLIAYSPLGMGLLTGKYTPDQPPTGVRGWNAASRLRKLQPLLTLLQDIGKAYGGKTRTQVALNWVICKGAIPIPGAKQAHHVQEHAGALGWRLSGDDIAALDAVSERCLD